MPSIIKVHMRIYVMHICLCLQWLDLSTSLYQELIIEKRRVSNAA